MTQDLNQNILPIQYNSLNLPSAITFSEGRSTRYTYRADGCKLKEVYTTAPPRPPTL